MLGRVTTGRQLLQDEHLRISRREGWLHGSASGSPRLPSWTGQCSDYRQRPPHGKTRGARANIAGIGPHGWLRMGRKADRLRSRKKSREQLPFIVRSLQRGHANQPIAPRLIDGRADGLDQTVDPRRSCTRPVAHKQVPDGCRFSTPPPRPTRATASRQTARCMPPGTRPYLSLPPGREP